MIDALYLISSEGRVFYERRWATQLSISLIKPLLELILREGKLPPISNVSDKAAFSLLNEDVYLVAIVSCEICPAYVLELLHQVQETLSVYFRVFNSLVLSEGINTVYLVSFREISQVIDEMFASGIPILNWPSLVTQIIKPPSFVDKLARSFGVSTKTKETTSLLSEPHVWRDAAATFPQNKILLDVIEAVNMTVGSDNSILFGKIFGKIVANVEWSGMPKIVVVVAPPSSGFECASLHVCADAERFESQHLIEFVPPNGTFELMHYTCGLADNRLPFNLSHRVSHRDGLVLTLILSPNHGIKQNVLDASITAHLPDCATACEITTDSTEKCVYNSFSNTMTWNVGVVTPENRDRSVSSKVKIDPECGPVSVILDISFRLSGTTMSGAKVLKLHLSSETDNDFKGIKYLSKSGHVELRL